MSTATALTLVSPEQPTRFGLMPTNIPEALTFCDYLSKSELVPKDYRGKPANIFVAMQHGMELGIPIMQALSGIAVINGRPTLWGDLMLALVMSHPSYEWHKERVEGEGDKRAGVFTIKRKGQDEHTVRFTVEDAKKAKLWGKEGPWANYPDRMLVARPRGFALRDKFADALKGMKSAEEVTDYTVIDGEFKEADKPAAAVPPVQVKAVTTQQARDFGKTWQLSGYSMDETKAWLKEHCGVESSLSIPADKFEAAMEWARRPDRQQSPDEQICRHAFADPLQWDLTRQLKEFEAAGRDWTVLASKINDELPQE